MNWKNRDCIYYKPSKKIFFCYFFHVCYMFIGILMLKALKEIKKEIHPKESFYYWINYKSYIWSWSSKCYVVYISSTWITNQKKNKYIKYWFNFWIRTYYNSFFKRFLLFLFCYFFLFFFFYFFYTFSWRFINTSIIWKYFDWCSISIQCLYFSLFKRIFLHKQTSLCQGLMVTLHIYSWWVRIIHKIEQSCLFFL